MATPTPSKPSRHQELTPSSFAHHLAAFSPLPSGSGHRSVAQSPAYLSKRSPASAAFPQHPQLSISNSNSGLNSALNFDSPSAAALGLSLNLPPLDHVTPSGNVRGDEEERRRRKIEWMLGLLRVKPGRVSEEGVERLAKRTGLDFDWEGKVGVAERMLSIAGTGVLIDINFQRDIVTRVAISFPTSAEAVPIPDPRATRILEKELMPKPGMSPLNTTLVPFAEHLERLARMDKLSAPGLNCFEAVSGIFTSLRRVFEWERDKVREKQRASAATEGEEEDPEKEVMCKRSGRPVMHARQRVGMSLEYWMERRCIPRKRKRSNPEAQPDPPSVFDSSDTDDKVWSLTVECESSPATFFPSVRVSDQWISPTVIKAQQPQPTSLETDDLFGPSPPSTGEESIEWLDPPPIFLSDTTALPPDAMLIDTVAAGGAGAGSKLPDVRFVARLERPVVVPLPVAYEIFTMVGATIPQETLEGTMFDGLLFGGYFSQGPSSTGAPPGGEDPEEGGKRLRREKTVMVHGPDGKMAGTRKHTYDVYVRRQEYGRVIHEIPFAHPRQIIAILPILRQYTSLSSLLSTTLPKTSTSTSSPMPSQPISKNIDPTAAPALADDDQPASPSLSDLDDFLALPNESSLPTLPTATATPSAPHTDPQPHHEHHKHQEEDEADNPSLPIDITLSTLPPTHTPRLTIVFPARHPIKNNKLLHLVLDVTRNGDLTLVGQNLVVDTSEEADVEGTMKDADEVKDVRRGEDSGARDIKRAVMVEKMTRALEIAEDIGVWVEWLRGV
ncbi:MAG: hypothetical protein M1817_002301 [Caeruleum heppii]|nr:MAG: hypothetical protein M1817_003515 [Caeruleum heppii]KAI9673664.1 MAG: hypothetical protein M1817_002301 [Caeruleum heppii]